MSKRINSRQKGARGERQWRDELRANGYDARRGQQFSGSSDSPDVVSKALSWIHFEVKAVERLNIEEAVAQACRDSGGKVPIVAHRRNRKGWLVTMPAEVFFDFLRGTLPPEPPKAESQSLLTSTATTMAREDARPPGESQRPIARSASDATRLRQDFGAASPAGSESQPHQVLERQEAAPQTNKQNTAVTEL